MSAGNSSQLPSDRHGRHALVLASSAGLGYAAAEALLKRGVSVVVSGRDPERLNRAVDRLASTGAEVAGIAGDTSTVAGMLAVLEAAAERVALLDILVVNSGGPPAKEFVSIDQATWVQAHEMLVLAPAMAIQHVLPAMMDRGFGRIVVIGSSGVHRALPDLCLSNVYRLAMLGLVKTLVHQAKSSGVTINMVCPGRIDTDRVRDLDLQRAARLAVTPEEVMRTSVAQIPVERYGRPEELGAVVAFLASEEASYVTGQSLLVDGGFVNATP